MSLLQPEFLVRRVRISRGCELDWQASLGTKQAILRVLPVWNFRRWSIVGKRKDLGDDYALVYVGKNPSALPEWLCGGGGAD
jgi:hypothetical protein